MSGGDFHFNGDTQTMLYGTCLNLLHSVLLGALKHCSFARSPTHPFVLMPFCSEVMRTLKHYSLCGFLPPDPFLLLPLCCPSPFHPLFIFVAILQFYASLSTPFLTPCISSAFLGLYVSNTHSGTGHFPIP